MNVFRSKPTIPLLRSLIPLAMACLALPPQAGATCQQGCSAVFSANTFLGEDTLINNGSGYNNTAVGFNALYNNTSGVNNTATGFQALFNNSHTPISGGNFNTAYGSS